MKILLAIDHSKCSKEAIKRVTAQLRTKGTQVHVVEPITAYVSATLIPHYVSHVAEIEEDRREPSKALGRTCCLATSQGRLQS